MKWASPILGIPLALAPAAAWANVDVARPVDLTTHGVGYAALAVFAVAYALVMTEEVTRLRKSKPVILAAGAIWAMIAVVYVERGTGHLVEQAARATFLDFSEVMVFLLVGMTYINTMQERRVFDALRAWLVRKRTGYRGLFWITGVLAFLISPVADNLTTALILSAVILAVGGENKPFVGISCVNIVVAANAGGAFSPFGDITTLMIWQKESVSFWTFFELFIPSLVNFLIPAGFMHFAVPIGAPAPRAEDVEMKPGARAVLFLFCCTIATVLVFHNYLQLPPVIGIMTGLGYLQILGYLMRRRAESRGSAGVVTLQRLDEPMPFDIFNQIARAEWDTLLFFYGVVLCVGGLAFIGYLDLVALKAYAQWGPTAANVTVGILSSFIDNIPVVFAVLAMDPPMSEGQWLLITLTAGVGGSLLSIGSAAGVAVMGQARGMYTFLVHLKWTPVIAVGYAASIAAHLWLNAARFSP